MVMNKHRARDQMNSDLAYKIQTRIFLIKHRRIQLEIYFPDSIEDLKEVLLCSLTLFRNIQRLTQYNHG